MASRYEIQVTTGQYAGKWVGVDSLAAAIAEFGSNGFKRESFRESEYYTVVLHDPEDGDVVWKYECTREEARAEVSELFKQGRSASYERE
jgi:hypothetical protein